MVSITRMRLIATTPNPSVAAVAGIFTATPRASLESRTHAIPCQDFCMALLTVVVETRRVSSAAVASAVRETLLRRGEMLKGDNINKPLDFFE
jgi:hypothetical protein